MSKTEVGKLSSIILLFFAFIGSVLIGAYFSGSKEQQAHENRFLLGRYGIWAVIREHSPHVKEGNCFIAASHAWTSSEFLPTIESMSFAPKFGVSLEEAAIAINLDRPELRVSLPDEILGIGAERHKLISSGVDFHINEEEFGYFNFQMSNHSTGLFRRIPLSREDIAVLIKKMLSGGQIFGVWQSRRALNGREQALGISEERYFLPLEGFDKAESLARARCDLGYSLVDTVSEDPRDILGVPDRTLSSRLPQQSARDFQETPAVASPQDFPRLRVDTVRPAFRQSSHSFSHQPTSESGHSDEIGEFLSCGPRCPVSSESQTR